MGARAAENSRPPQTTPSRSSSNWVWLGITVIICATALAYVPAMSGKFIWDDDYYIINNRALENLEGLRQIWVVPGSTPQYYPLVFTTFWVEHKLWGLQPAGYHIVNVALHIAAALLLWRVLFRLGLGMGVAWVCAAIFAVHPVHAESVAWVTERKNVLSGVFYLGALLLGLSVFQIATRSEPISDSRNVKNAKAKSQPRAPAPHASSWKPTPYFAMVGLFIAALLSKSVTCSLPAVVALLIWWKRGRVTVREWLALAPMFIIGAGFALNTVIVEKHHVGVEAMNLDYSFLERCLIAGKALWFYAQKIVWPHPLIFIYPRWHISASHWWLYLYPLSALAVIIALWLLRSRIGRGPLVAVLIFAGTLLPALGFIDVYPMVYSFVADHFQYLASISFFVLIVAAATNLLHRWPLVRIGLTGIIIAALSVLCFREGAKYDNVVALWEDTINKNKGDAMARTNLAFILVTDEVTRHAAANLYREVLALKDPALHPVVISRAHYGLGMYLISQHRPEEALVEMQDAARLTPDQPRSHYGVGFALEAQGRWDEAIAAFQRALDLRPDMPQATEALERVMDAKQRQPPR